MASSFTSNSEPFTAKKYLRVEAVLFNSGSIDHNITFNGSASGYSKRSSTDGGSDSTASSQTSIDVLGESSDSKFIIMDITNRENKDKLTRLEIMRSSNNRCEAVADWANNSQITSIKITNTGSGSYDSDSTLSVYGTD